MLFKHSKT